MTGHCGVRLRSAAPLPACPVMRPARPRSTARRSLAPTASGLRGKTVMNNPEFSPKFGGEAHYTVDGYPGIAFYLTGWAQEYIPETVTNECGNAGTGCPCDPEENEECWLYSEPEWVDSDSQVIAVMVGDDQRHTVNIDDLTEIHETGYCRECGQTGCTAVVYE